MANSDAEGLIYFSTSDYGDDQPHDALNARCAMNNAEHLADMDMQVRVSWSLPEHQTALTNASGSTSLWYKIAQFGPFPLRLDTNGIPYPLRVRMGGASTGAATQVKMRLCVSARRTAYDEMIGAGANVLEVATSSTTAAWLTATTGASGTTLLTFTDAQASDAYVSSLSTIDAVGGDPIAVETFEWVATVWGQNTGAAETEPALGAVYAAEFVGV